VGKKDSKKRNVHIDRCTMVRMILRKTNYRARLCERRRAGWEATTMRIW
jgi:hypothetical protein